jgi:hypothetical protein
MTGAIIPVDGGATAWYTAIDALDPTRDKYKLRASVRIIAALLQWGEAMSSHADSVIAQETRRDRGDCRPEEQSLMRADAAIGGTRENSGIEFPIGGCRT